MGGHIVSDGPARERMRATVDAAWQESRRKRSDAVIRMFAEDLAEVGVDAVMHLLWSGVARLSSWVQRRAWLDLRPGERTVGPCPRRTTR